VTAAYSCWVCGSGGLQLRKPSDMTDMRPEDFAISDAHYGRTSAIYQCPSCGFLECPEEPDVVRFYEALEDPSYVASRPSRCLQSQALLKSVARLTGRPLAGLRLLDVGAGSGPMVEAARAAGMTAEGVEPSVWLRDHAVRLGLPVHLGVLPHPDVQGVFDVVTLVDVIEHTTDPRQLLEQAARLLAPGGVVVLVTPDVSSFFASVLGWRWWHYRAAHVGYFNRVTLTALCARVGLSVTRQARPWWVLPLPYLLERAGRYLPVRLPTLTRLERLAVPFNLGDSLLFVARQA
jgi:SAM-dependent methyltransferase